MSKPTGTSLRLVQHIHCHQCRLLMLRYHHLRNPLTIIDDKRLVRQIHQDDTHLTPVVSIYRARRIQHRHSLLDSQARAWTHLCFIALRQRYKQPRWHQRTCQRLQCDRSIQIRPQVHSCRLRGGILRQRMMRPIDDFHFHIPKIWLQRYERKVKSKNEK